MKLEFTCPSCNGTGGFHGGYYEPPEECGWCDGRGVMTLRGRLEWMLVCEWPGAPWRWFWWSAVRAFWAWADRPTIAFTGIEDVSFPDLYYWYTDTTPGEW